MLGLKSTDSELHAAARCKPTALHAVILNKRGIEHRQRATARVLQSVSSWSYKAHLDGCDLVLEVAQVGVGLGELLGRVRRVGLEHGDGILHRVPT